MDAPGGGLLIRFFRAMLFLYHLPNWLMAVCIVGAVVALAYPGYVLLHRLWRRSFTEAETNVSMAVLNVIATIFALLLAFVAVTVWQAFGAAETAVVNESNSVGELARALSLFDSPQARQARGTSPRVRRRRRDGGMARYASGAIKHLRRGTRSTECFMPSANSNPTHRVAPRSCPRSGQRQTMS